MVFEQSLFRICDKSNFLFKTCEPRRFSSQSGCGPLGIPLDFSARNLVPEQMDQPGLSERQHLHALRGLRTINWISRTVPAVRNGLRQLIAESLAESKNVSTTQRDIITPPLHILDIACGGGDLTRLLAKSWPKSEIPVRWYGWDLSQTAVKSARETLAAERGSDKDQVEYSAFDAINDPFQRPDGQPFDIIFCTLFLHHLETETAIELLRKMSRQARLGILVDDLTRSRFSYYMTVAGCHLLSRSPIVHFDGPQSVRAAFTEPEFREMARQAGLQNVSLSWHWPQRLQLISRSEK